MSRKAEGMGASFAVILSEDRWLNGFYLRQGSIKTMKAEVQRLNRKPEHYYPAEDRLD